MLGRRGNIHWYDLVLFALVAAIVYPDVIVEWLSGVTGRGLGWGSLLLVEFLAILGVVVAMYFLMPIYPRLGWWHPLFYVGAVSFFRVGMWCVSRFLGFED